MGLLFIKVFVMRDAYAPLLRAEDCWCVTMVSTMWAASTAKLGNLRAYRNLISLAGARGAPQLAKLLAGRAVDKYAAHYSAGGNNNKVALGLGPL